MWEVNNFDAVTSEPNKATTVQISIIESLLIRAAIDQKEKDEIYLYLDMFSEEEAYQTIKYLEEKAIETDPAKQYKKFKNL